MLQVLRGRGKRDIATVTRVVRLGASKEPAQGGGWEFARPAAE